MATVEAQPELIPGVDCYHHAERKGCAIYCGDCLPLMRKMPDSSVQLILTDPPYFKVKDEDWDHQWQNQRDFLRWFRELCIEWRRVLAPNGSLYVFASPRMAARVECEVSEWFAVLTHIVWRKRSAEGCEHAGTHGRACKEELRGFFPQTERIIFAEHCNADNMAKGEAGYAAKCDELRGFVFEPLRAYLEGERLKAGVDFDQVRQMVGCADGSGLPSHWFTRSQWALPTEDKYERLRIGFNRHANGSGPVLTREYEDLRREYEDLRREYEDLRREYEDLRRPFNVTADVPYTDVWDFPTVQAYKGKHPCEKPAAMMEHVINASSREGDTVLDCFMGSGVTLKAAHRLGRRAIGIEKESRWCRKLKHEFRQETMF